MLEINKTYLSYLTLTVKQKAYFSAKMDNKEQIPDARQNILGDSIQLCRTRPDNTHTGYVVLKYTCC